MDYAVYSRWWRMVTNICFLLGEEEPLVSHIADSDSDIKVLKKDSLIMNKVSISHMCIL